MKINGKPDGGGGSGVITGLSVTENGIYMPSAGVDGFAPVDVDVQPSLQDKTVSVNGSYTADQGYYGLSTVTVNVPDIPAVTESLTVSVNNTYYPGQGVDGFSQVIVDVPQSVTGYTEKDLTEKTFTIVNLNNSASYVAAGAFTGNTQIQTVNLPNCLKVNGNAFTNCTNLSQVSLPICSSIEQQAFQGCVSLTSLNLPECKNLNIYAFNGCRTLSEINLPECTYINNYAFDGCSRLISINLPKCLSISQAVFQNCSLSLSQVSLPVCSTIGPQAFVSCYLLEQVNLPECLSVDNSAYRKCSSLSSISLPKCLFMGGLVFESCSSLSEIYLPNCVSIGGATFNMNNTLTTVSLGALQNISKWYNNPVIMTTPNVSQLYIGTETYGVLTYTSMFSSGTNFDTLLQSGIGSIYTHWQNYNDYINAPGWSSLSSLFVSVGDPDKPILSFSDGALTGYTRNILSNFSTYLGVSKSLITTVSLPDCTYIGSNAFDEYVNISEFYLPNVSYIETRGFAECYHLSSINLPECRYIASNTFQWAAYSTPEQKFTLTLGYTGVCRLGGTGVLDNIKKGFSVYVPASLVDAYKSATYWASYSSRIFPIE